MNKQYIPRAYSLTEHHRAMIEAHAKATGLNKSAALRDILDKAQEAGITGGDGGA